MQEKNCVFCSIIQKKIPAEVIYEDADFLAFLDIHPKEHYRYVWDVPNAGAYFEAAKKVALAQKKAFGTDFILSKIVGEEVPHAHIWVFPDSAVAGDKADFAGNAEKIRKAME